MQIWVALVLLSACGIGERVDSWRAGGSRGSAKVGGQIVSTVDGHPIPVGEVQELVQAGLSLHEALLRLQAERLLVGEAARRGFASDTAVVEVARQARVQALLESEAAAVVVSDQDIRQAYQKGLARFERPPRRSSVHVLAKLARNPSPEADAAARAYAASVLPELASAQNLDAFIADQRQHKAPEFKVVAERIGAIDAKADLVEPFMDALFSLPEPGVVAQPVRTIYGWHAIRVIEILPAESTPYEKVTETLRAELLLSRRKQHVQELLEKLRAEYGVQVSDNVGHTLARLEL